MNKMAYQKPWAELIQFENGDIVNTSREASCTAETGCTGGCVAPGWDNLGVCECGIHSGSEVSGIVGYKKVCLGIGISVPVYESYWCHGGFEAGKAYHGGGSGGARTFSEDYGMGLEDGFDDIENWGN